MPGATVYAEVTPRALLGVVLACLAGAPRAADAQPYCSGEYAEDLAALSQQARANEAATGSYSYAVRTVATYECVSYGSDGNLKKTRATARAYGTAFGYRRDGADTLLLTNQHVAEWPAVTDDEHPIDGVPAGCKRISDSLKIVDDDHDGYAADDIPLSRVVADPALDVAILRAHAKLAIIPWRIGKSAALQTRHIVEVKGFPLGEFQATNVGKVISPHDHDVQGERNHDDFVIDALLSTGGSGSPVFAVSCKTGEFELVGIFHAHYTGASALNVVVAIDQARDMMATLKRSPRTVDRAELDAAARAQLVEAIGRSHDPPFFPFGSLVASVRARGDGTLVFAVFPSDFPRTASPVIALEDAAADDPKLFGQLAAVYLGGALGLQPIATDTDAEAQALLARTLVALREAAIATFDWRDAARKTAGSRTAFERTAGKKRALTRMLDGQRETTQALVDLASHAPRPTGPALSLADIEAAAAIVAGHGAAL